MDASTMSPDNATLQMVTQSITPNVKGSPAISCLDQSLFWHILTINAVMDKEKTNTEEPCALNTLRHTSQVCSSWRNHILSSPSLWGQVINFNRLGRVEWREEVLRRANSAPLCLFGVRVDDKDGAILSIIVNNWQMIRRVQLSLCQKDYHQKVREDQTLWEAFGSPSPVLEVFKVLFYDKQTTEDGDVFHVIGHGSSQFLSPEGFKPFGGHAPSLIAYDAPNILFDLSKASWITHLHSLSLNIPCQVHDVIQALTKIPTLKSLNVFSLTSGVIHVGHRSSTDPRTPLPCLKRIVIHSDSDLDAYTTLLSYIRPADDHNLVFTYFPDGDPQYTEAQLSNIGNILETYTAQASQWLAGSTEIVLTLREGTFQLMLSGGGREYTIDLSGATPPSQHLHRIFGIHLLRQFHISIVNTIVKLQIHAEPDVIPFLLGILNRSFTSVKALVVTPHIISSMADLSEEVFISTFPNLNKVVSNYIGAAPFITGIQKFVVRRQEAGLSVPALSIVIMSRADVQRLLDTPGLNLHIIDW